MTGALFQHERVDLGRSFGTFLETSLIYGAKAAGLLALPVAWCPRFFALPVSVNQNWKRSGGVDLSVFGGQLLDWLRNFQAHEWSGIIVRSSGVSERIGDRGKYLSIALAQNLTSISELESAINDIFIHAHQVDPKEQLGIVLQEFLTPGIVGHLSNETRLSPTRNQWKYEIEKPTWTPPRGLNSKFAPMPDTNQVISCGLVVPHQALRSVGRWINDNVVTRSHLEWITNEGGLYVVQLDFEWAQHDVGIDPSQQNLSMHSKTPNLSAAKRLVRYGIGNATPWKKLRNLNDFDLEEQDRQPNIYQMEGPLLELAITDPKLTLQLVSEVDSLTGGRVVVRTDCKAASIRSFNLPRTDTVSPAVAIEWSKSILRDLNRQGVETADVMFLLHAFIPAYASAWVYSQHENPNTIVDALWGLPDGLQVLPHDTYEVNTKRKVIVPPTSRYKSRFLAEEPDGSWRYKDVLRSRGRSKVLQRRDILEIAERTSQIAEKLGQDAQIMWFCGIPGSLGIGRNLPWYRSRESLDQAPRVDSRYRPYDVRNPGDLRNLPDREAMIRLSPEANLIRDEAFLQQVIDVALKKRLPVELQGSLLGHTYYRLSNAGIAVALAEVPKYTRVRERKTFGKLVRDSVPEGIKRGGERVLEALLDRSDILPALGGKLVEELEEFLRAHDLVEKTAELADLLEVLRGLATASEVKWENVESAAKQKKEKRGGFEQRRILLETSLPLPSASADKELVVRLVDIAHVGAIGNEITLPLSLLMASIVGRPISIKADEPGIMVRFHVDRGNLKIGVSTQDLISQGGETQLSFDWDENEKRGGP